MLQKFLFKHQNNWVGFILRLTIAVVLFPHGAQKLLGWWNGHGYDGNMEFFVKTIGLPYIIGWLVIMIEFFCPIFILIGFASRFWSILVVVVMTGVIVTVQHQYFFMNWFNNQKGEGMEFFLLLIGLGISLILNGSGKISVDNLINRILKK